MAGSLLAATGSGWRYFVKKVRDREERERRQALLRALDERMSNTVLDFGGFLDEELRPTDKALNYLRAGSLLVADDD